MDAGAADGTTTAQTFVNAGADAARKAGFGTLDRMECTTRGCRPTDPPKRASYDGLRAALRGHLAWSLPVPEAARAPQQAQGPCSAGPQPGQAAAGSDMTTAPQPLPPAAKRKAAVMADAESRLNVPTVTHGAKAPRPRPAGERVVR